MRFVCDGRVYVTTDMRMFRTPDPAIPSVFLTRDGRATFVVTCDSDGTLSVHRAATGEIIALSRRHCLSGLLGAFPSTFAPARIVEDGLIVEDGSYEPFHFEPLVPTSPHLLSETPETGTPRAGVLT